MLRETRARLSNQAATWRHLGLIDAGLAERLAERYDARGTAGAALLKWLGFFGVFLLVCAILGFIGVAAASAGYFGSAVFLAIATAAVGWVGGRLAIDPRRRYPVLGSALLTVSLVGGYGALALFVLGFGGRLERAYGVLLFFVSAAAFFVAYRFRLRWPLLLALLFFFHGVGSWHAYAGHGAYFADIADERLMALVALLAIGFGMYHESTLEEGWLARHVGFGSLYLIFGLLYFNLSLWFLTIPDPTLAWVLVFAAGAIAQIVAGAAFKDSRFTGFGIVFLSINIYTRFFEHFWDRLSAGAFFAAAGLAALVLGFIFERLGSRPGAAA
jgi:uncharacterized membrane protein